MAILEEFSGKGLDPHIFFGVIPFLLNVVFAFALWNRKKWGLYGLGLIALLGLYLFDIFSVVLLVEFFSVLILAYDFRKEIT